MNQNALNQTAAIVLRIFSLGYFADTFYNLTDLPYDVYGFLSYHGGYFKNIHAMMLVSNIGHIVFNLALGIVLFKCAKPLAAFFTRGLQDYIKPESEEGVWPPSPRRPADEQTNL